jgi:threonine dehydrogenase-like Zn-dependent dehydrogenase
LDRTMKGLQYDGKLQLRHDLPLPERPSGEALIKVLMAGICQTDIEITKGYMAFKGIPGHEFVGVVEAADSGSLIGKRVVGEINCACRACDNCTAGMYNHCTERSVLGIAGRHGAFAEHLTLPERNLHHLPDAISNEEAVFVEPLAACYRILEQVPVAKDSSVLVLGDGRMGLLCSQVLKTTRAEVTVLGKHKEKLSLLKGLGINTKMTDESLRGVFDIVVDCTGSPGGLSTALSYTRPQGILFIKSTVAAQRSIDFNNVVINEIQIRGSRCGPFAPAIQALQKKEVVVAPLISGIFPLDQGVEAFHAAAQKENIKILLQM